MNKQLIRLSIPLLSVALIFSGCNNSQNGQVQNSADTLRAKIDTAAQNIKQAVTTVASNIKEDWTGDPDSVFVVRATTANMEEIGILQAGIEDGTSKELKTHARMMLADHKKLAGKVATYANGRGFPLPATDNGKANDELAKLNKNSKGPGWDKAWVDFMVNAHSDAINLFENGENNVKDSALKNMITNTLPTLHNHYDMMKQLQNNMTGQ